MSSQPGLTIERTIRRGKPVRRGTDGPYYGLMYGPGEPRVRRLELAPATQEPMERVSLLHFAHLTDVHVIDPQSPGRYEFIQRHAGPIPLGLIVPSYRPQESLNIHALEAMIRTVNAIEESPETGAPVQFAFFGGDHTDNAQMNELNRFTDLLTGAVVHPNTGDHPYEGVQAPDWDDPHYWHPDPYPDRYKEQWGFPEHPGLLTDAIQPFEAQGIRLPWFSCYGNHDALVDGAARANPEYDRLLTGDHKAQDLPPGFDPLDKLYAFIPNPESYLGGPTRRITPDPTRRTYGRRAYVEKHLSVGGSPEGHGFTGENVALGTAYYIRDDYPGVRVIVLNTVNPGGYYMGSMGARQLDWLEQRLIEVHSCYYAQDGTAVETGNDDRVVVICSHHGLTSLTNLLVAYEDDAPRFLGPEVEAFLHRFPNVVLWVNGHTHRNRIYPRPDPEARAAGFWEVTTSSIIDWPSQTRLIELVQNGNGTLSVLCTMIDHNAPVDPQCVDGLARLGALHRELTANNPYDEVPDREGTPADRNVELVIPAPF